MRHAFEKVGVKSPKSRLRAAATDAIDASLGGAEAPEHNDAEAKSRLKEHATMAIERADLNMNAACGLFLAALMRDGQALNELVGDIVRKRAAEYLHEVWNEEFSGRGVHVREHERGKRGQKTDGQIASEAQSGTVVGGGGDQIQSGTQIIHASAALSPERIAAARMRGAWFDLDDKDSDGRKLGDLTYDQVAHSARHDRDNGLRDLHRAYVKVRMLKAATWHPGMSALPAREWADQNAITAANERFSEFGHLLTGEIDQYLEHATNA